jgi:hypothetical protein
MPIVAEKNVMKNVHIHMTKNILDGQKDGGKTVYPAPSSGSGGIV